MNARTIVITSVAVLMLFVMVMPAAADGIIIPDPICPPSLCRSSLAWTARARRFCPARPFRRPSARRRSPSSTTRSR